MTAPSSTSDRLELLRAAAGGDAEAFDRVVAAYATRLRWLIRLRIDPALRARISADDVLQETMLVASKRIERLVIDDEGAFWGWLCRVVEDRLADVRRRHLGAAKRDARRDVGGVSSARGAGREPPPSGPARRQEDRAALERAMTSLPPSFRDVIMLRVVEGASAAETAAIMGRTAGAVRVLLSRALRRLGETLETEP